MASTAVDVQGTIDMLALGNYKSQIDLIINGAIGHHTRLNGLFESNLGNLMMSFAGTNQNMPEATASQVEQGGALAPLITQLMAALASSQQQVKVAATTPPVTA